MSFFLKKNCQTNTVLAKVFKCVGFFVCLGKNVVSKPSSQVAQTKAGESGSIGLLQITNHPTQDHLFFIFIFIFLFHCRRILRVGNESWTTKATEIKAPTRASRARSSPPSTHTPGPPTRSRCSAALRPPGPRTRRALCWTLTDKKTQIWTWT